MLQLPLLRDILQLRYRVSRALNAGSCLIALAFAVILAPLPAAPGDLQKRVALIIGNSAYRGKLALKNPRNDAEAFAKALNKVSPRFEIVKITDMQANGREAILSRLEQSAANASIALFYYAGHALQANDDNYLLPVDMPDRPATLSGLKALRLSEVLDRMKGATHAKLVFLDACRDNPFKTRDDTLPFAAEKTRQAAGLRKAPSGRTCKPCCKQLRNGRYLYRLCDRAGRRRSRRLGRKQPVHRRARPLHPGAGLGNQENADAGHEGCQTGNRGQSLLQPASDPVVQRFSYQRSLSLAAPTGCTRCTANGKLSRRKNGSKHDPPAPGPKPASAWPWRRRGRGRALAHRDPLANSTEFCL